MTNEEVSKAILSYLLKHPDAKDTLEGIATWWILKQRIEVETQQVSEIVKELVEKSVLIEQTVGKDTKVYSLNKDKLSEIAV